MPERGQKAWDARLLQSCGASESDTVTRKTPPQAMATLLPKQDARISEGVFSSSYSQFLDGKPCEPHSRRHETFGFYTSSSI